MRPAPIDNSRGPPAGDSRPDPSGETFDSIPDLVTMDAQNAHLQESS